MMNFDQYLRALLEQAGREAREDGSATIEAQHLLLAMASQSETEPGPWLRAVGLDHRALRAALDQEFEHGLRAAGVSLEASQRPRATGASPPPGALGSSVQQALERGLQGLETTPRPRHLLLGILLAELGSVPRALTLAGFDRGDLLGQVRQTLAAE